MATRPKKLTPTAGKLYHMGLAAKAAVGINLRCSVVCVGACRDAALIPSSCIRIFVVPLVYESGVFGAIPGSKSPI